MPEKEKDLLPDACCKEKTASSGGMTYDEEEMPFSKDNIVLETELNHAEENDRTYEIIDPKSWYRAGVYRHFTEDCRCSISLTVKIDVSDLIQVSKKTGTRFHLNFLYLLCRVLNSRKDFRLGYLYDTGQLICWDKIHPCHYLFFEETETCTPVYSRYDDDYDVFYAGCLEDLKKAKENGTYQLDAANHPNWFDASCLPWISYEALHIELPDGYLYFSPIINWGKFSEENGRWMMPVTVRLNHAAADGYLASQVFVQLEKQIRWFGQNALDRMN